LKPVTLYLFVLCCIAGISSCAQGNTIPQQQSVSQPVLSNDSFRLEKFIPGNFNFMEVDILNNLYLVTAGNQLKKMNDQGDSMGVFNDVKKYGNPSLVDVNNPLRTLLYYKNFATLVMLDRLLSQRNSINFRKQNIFSVKAVANAYDNNIWVFDEQDMSLKKINEDGKVLQQSTDWRLLMSEVPSPVTIIDANNFVYLYDPAKGFYIFDYYGTYKNNLPFLKWSSISISNGMLAGFSGNQFFLYQLQSLNLRTYTLPVFFKGYSVIKAMNGKIYLLKKDGIYIYSVL
jgi:hypothetical protein